MPAWHPNASSAIMASLRIVVLFIRELSIKVVDIVSLGCRSPVKVYRKDSLFPRERQTPRWEKHGGEWI